MTLRANKPLRLVAIAGAIALLYVFAVRALFFRNIFYEHAGVTITQHEVFEKYGSIGDQDPTNKPVVPRIIHQIFHNWTDPSNEEIPADWDEARHSCIDLNPDWEYKLWTSQASRSFIETEYPWFLKTYDELPFPVQRIDTLRYFLMRHFGGIYIDLDNGCAHNLDPLRYFPTWVTDGGRGALSNNILGAEPHHPFWDFLTESIETYAWNYPLPFVTISYASGQWFETAIWQHYHQQHKDEPGLVRVMADPGLPDPDAPWSFFTQNRGGTWDQWDKQWFDWIGEHIPLFATVVVGAILVFVVMTVLLVRGVGHIMRARSKGYSKLDH